jgi:DNA polymerase III epsilon subunit-like protein
MKKILKEFNIRMRWAKVVGYRAAFDRDFIEVFVGEE